MKGPPYSNIAHSLLAALYFSVDALLPTSLSNTEDGGRQLKLTVPVTTGSGHMLSSEYAAIHVPHVRRFIATCSSIMPSDALNYEMNPTILTAQRVRTHFFLNYFTLGPLHDKEMYVLTVIALCIIIH